MPEGLRGWRGVRVLGRLAGAAAVVVLVVLTMPAAAAGHRPLLAGFVDWLAGSPGPALPTPADLSRFRAALGQDTGPLEQLARHCGYRLTGIAVRSGADPGVDLALAYQRALEATEQAALAARLAERPATLGVVEQTLVRVLLAASASADARQPGGYRLAGVGIALERLPAVTLTLEPVPAEPPAATLAPAGDAGGNGLP